MTFDDELRDGLGSAAENYAAGPPPTAALLAAARRRRAARLRIGAAAAVAVFALLVGLAVALPRGGSTPKANLSASGGRSTGDDATGPPGGSVNEPGATTTLMKATGATTTAPTAGYGTIGTAGTAYAPPASVVYPSRTTTTLPRATTTAPPSNANPVIVTQDDDQKSFTLRVGQKLEVRLSRSGTYFSEPATDADAVLHRTGGSADDTSGDAVGYFTAAAVGQAHVTANQEPACRRSQPACMIAERQYQVTVNVVA